MADRATGKFRIFQDEVKLRHTNHWDMDTMSRSELDACMSGDHRKANPDDPRQAPTQRPLTPGDSPWSRFLRAILPQR